MSIGEIYCLCPASMLPFTLYPEGIFTVKTEHVVAVKVLLL
jgi:hypothetical protein